VLIDTSVTARFMTLLKVGERAARRNGIHFVVAVIVKGDVDEGVVGQSQDEVAHVVGLGLRELFEYRLDSALVFVGVLF
jgi:hypothetical protein